MFECVDFHTAAGEHWKEWPSVVGGCFEDAKLGILAAPPIWPPPCCCCSSMRSYIPFWALEAARSSRILTEFGDIPTAAGEGRRVEWGGDVRPLNGVCSRELRQYPLEYDDDELDEPPGKKFSGDEKSTSSSSHA
jgi:hypothetical protein